MSLIPDLNEQPGWKMIAGLASLAGAGLGLIISAEPAMNAWDHAGLPTVATRSFVRDDNKSTKFQIIDMQLDIARGKLDQNLIARNQLEIAALKYDDESKVKAAQEMRRLDDTITALRGQIRSMLPVRGPQ